MIDDGRSQTVSDALLRQVLIILERIEKQEMLARLGLSDDDDPLSRQAKELSAMGEISLAAQEMIYNHQKMKIPSCYALDKNNPQIMLVMALIYLCKSAERKLPRFKACCK